MHIEMFEPIGK